MKIQPKGYRSFGYAALVDGKFMEFASEDEFYEFERELRLNEETKSSTNENQKNN